MHSLVALVDMFRSLFFFNCLYSIDMHLIDNSQSSVEFQTFIRIYIQPATTIFYIDGRPANREKFCGDLRLIMYFRVIHAYNIRYCVHIYNIYEYIYIYTQTSQIEYAHSSNFTVVYWINTFPVVGMSNCNSDCNLRFGIGSIRVACSYDGWVMSPSHIRYVLVYTFIAGVPCPHILDTFPILTSESGYFRSP